MNLFSRLSSNKLSQIIQLKIHKNRNRAAFEMLQSLGFSLPLIRRSLLQLNDIEMSKLAKSNGGISWQSISHAITGVRRSKTAMKLVSKSLGLKVKELFPE